MIARFIAVTKRYFEVEGLSNLTLNIEAGETIGLLGANGAGKTTTLKLLAGLIYPTIGEVWVLDQPPAKVLDQIGYLGDQDPCLPWMEPSDIKKVMLNLFNGFDPDRFDSLLAELEVPVKQTFSSFSKGQKARVKLAMLLARKCKLLLLDEPLSGIDFLSREKMMETITNHKQEDGAIIFSTHDIRDAQGLFSRALFIREGNLLKDLKLDAESENQQTILEEYREVLA